MTHLTTLDELKKHITLLASVEESGAPFISAYLNLEDEQSGWRETLNEHARILRSVLKDDDLTDFEEALGKIEAWLATNLLSEAKGAALFVRGNFGGAFMLPMQFAAPLPNWITVYPTPNTYHLVELKDTYERYLVMIATSDWVRILEVNLGSAAIKAWSEHPPLRERMGWEWSGTQCQPYRGDHGAHFLQEEIRILEQLIGSDGYSHLILAGDPQITDKIRHNLPETLASKLMDIIPATRQDAHSDIVTATLSAFVELEERESQSIAARLIQAIRTQGQAVVGVEDCAKSLQQGRGDTLVMLQKFHSDPGWFCTACESIGVTTPKTNFCPHCGTEAVRPTDLREELVRLAGKWDCPVEVVEISDDLAALGGVGCLLRYRQGLLNERSSDLAQI